jgi:hypothetical protein
MRTMIIGGALLCITTAALAQPRASTLDMTCGQARALVAARGAAVLSTGPRTYDRYVAWVGACQRGQVTAPAWAQTADNPQCPIGYRCRDTDLDNGR